MVIAYLRVSTSKQHLVNQQDEIRRFAHTKEIEVSRWVTEIVSGKKNQKERKLGRVINQLKPGDTLIVTEISRLSRTLTEIMTIMGKCLEKNITIYSTKDGYAFDNTINSKVLCFAFGLVAEIERNLISMRTKEALALRKAEGVILGRKKGSITKLKILVDNELEIIDRLKKRRIYGFDLPYIRSLYRYVLQIQKGLSKRRRSIPIQDDAFLCFVKIKITPEKKHRGENKETYFFRRSSRSSGSFVVIKSAASSIKYCKSSALFTVQTLTVKPKS